MTVVDQNVNGRDPASMGTMFQHSDFSQKKKHCVTTTAQYAEQPQQPTYNSEFARSGSGGRGAGFRTPDRVRQSSNNRGMMMPFPETVASAEMNHRSTSATRGYGTAGA